MGQRNGAYTPGHNLHVLQNYNNPNPAVGNRRHAGIDLRYDEGAGATVHAPVYPLRVSAVAQRPRAQRLAGTGLRLPGQTPDEEGWRDPGAAVFGHQLAFPSDTYTDDVSMNLRAEPSLKAEVVTSIPANATVTALGLSPDLDGANHRGIASTT